MKKTLLSLSLAFFGLAVSSQAQVVFTQDFEGVTAPALPTGASGFSSAGSTGSPNWITGTALGTTWGAKVGQYNIPTSSKYVAVDGDKYPGQLNDTLSSAAFDLTGKMNPYLNFDGFFYSANKNSTPPGKEEKA